jgi:NitT/TauT family transport system substrate-binding protein
MAATPRGPEWQGILNLRGGGQKSMILKRPVIEPAARFGWGLAAAVVLAAGCGGSATPSTASKQPVTVTVAQSIVAMANAGMFVAMQNGYFKQQNINVNLTTLQSGAVTTQAMASGSVDAVASAALDVAAAAGAGVPFQAFVTESNISLEVCASSKFVAGKGLTASSSLSQVMAAFRGETMGITGPNSAPDLALRYLLPRYGHLKPDTDVKITALGSLPAELTALARGQIAGFVQSPPGCEEAIQAGTGVSLVKPKDVPEFKGAPLWVLYSRKDWINTHKDIVSRLARAVVKGDEFVHQHPQETIQILHRYYFTALDQGILADAFTNIQLPLVPRDGRSTAAGWKKISDLEVASGAISKGLDVREGGIWSNRYL